MRIFLICQQSTQAYPVPAYAFWERYFKNGIREAGHEVVELESADWARGLMPLPAEELARWRTDQWERAVPAIRREHATKRIDFLLAYLFPQQVEPAAIQQIRSLGVPCVNFFCDNVREFTHVPETFRVFDLHWTPEAEARAMYQRAGHRSVYAPMPMWVPPEQRNVPEKETDDITFIGSHDVLREELLAEAVGRGLTLRLHGAGWSSPSSPHTQSPPVSGKLQNQLAFLRRYGIGGFVHKLSYKAHRCPDRAWLAKALQPPISDAEYSRVTRESAVTLGINRYPSFRHSFNRPHAYSRLRDLEAPMLGACYLTEAAPGLSDLYEFGKEIEIYRNAEELVDKARALRADPARRRRLREAGQRRALAEHTIPRSLARLAQALA